VSYIGAKAQGLISNIDGGTIENATLGSSVSFPSFVGMIASFAMSSAPSGWLVCNGAEYAIASYGDLYTAIGTTWGALTNGSGGAGSTHFRVPDLRGEFLRGFDNGTGNDPDASSRTGGDAVGSSQGQALQRHNHGLQIYGGGSGNYRLNVSVTGDGNATAFDQPDQVMNTSGYYGTWSTETRPRNKYVQYCIKY
jgi:microcystin-dependent protein